MRPHTRTQCQQENGPNQCQECNVAHSTSSNSSGLFLEPSTSATSASSPLSTTPTHSIRDRHFSSVDVSSNMSSVSTCQQEQRNRTPALVEMPAELLVKILGYLSFNDLSLIRMVSRRFNELSASILNATFASLQNSMLERFQDIKSKMPRRESARRNHPLARECDIIETLHMRLTLLHMTFGKHIERKHVCFFAGEILDEVYRVLRYIKTATSLARAYKITDELFDLSTMAMEYFKEKLEPTLPEITFFGTDFLDFSTPFTGSPCKKRMQNGNMSLSDLVPSSSCSSVAGSSFSDSYSNGSLVSNGVYDDEDPEFNSEGSITSTGSNMVLRKRIRKIRLGMKRYNTQLVEVKRELKSTKAKMENQTKQVTDYSQRLEEYDKKFEESSRKFQTLLTELNKCKTELQFWRSKSSLLLSIPTSRSICSKCETNSIFSPAKEGAEEHAIEDDNHVPPQNGIEDQSLEHDSDDLVSLASCSDISGHDFKALANQGIFLPEDLGVMTRHMTSNGVDSATSATNNLSNGVSGGSGGNRGAFTRSSVDGSALSSEQNSKTKVNNTKTVEAGGVINNPASPRPVTRSRPPSPDNVGSSRKRKSTEDDVPRKSLRGSSGVKNKNKAKKRPKVC